MLLLKLLLIAGCVAQMVLALVLQFESFDRNVFKRKKQRYAAFDERGILTMDGTLNGKSNDVIFPNLNSGEMGQDTCQLHPGLVFEICETQRLGAWIGVAICYESQLNRAYINPFFRIKPESEKLQHLTKVLCGEGQSAIFIDRETPEIRAEGAIYLSKERDWNAQRQNASRKYTPFYSISTSFAPKKLYFQMPDQVAEKRCVLVHLGGKKLVHVNLTTLRREPIRELYTDVTVGKEGEEGAERMLKRLREENVNNNRDSNNTVDRAEFFANRFPDMSNRQHMLSQQQNLWLLMLDFVPPFGHLQNISIYGWLPIRIKIAGYSIQPCRIDWEFLQSRELSGITSSMLQIQYTVETGVMSNLQREKGSSASKGTNKQDSDMKSISGGFNIPILKWLSVGLSASYSTSNMKGSEESTSTSLRENLEVALSHRRVRTETVTFNNFRGSISVEQMVYRCYGSDIRMGKIRYHDTSGEEMLPNGMDVDAPEQMEMDLAPTNNFDDCDDLYEECAIWASQGECRKTPVYMLTNCRRSCRICTTVRINSKSKEFAGNTMPQKTPEELIDSECWDLEGSAVCRQLVDVGECIKNPKEMSLSCRQSCGLCLAKEDFRAMRREWRLNEGLDDYL